MPTSDPPSGAQRYVRRVTRRSVRLKARWRGFSFNGDSRWFQLVANDWCPALRRRVFVLYRSRIGVYFTGAHPLPSSWVAARLLQPPHPRSLTAPFYSAPRFQLMVYKNRTSSRVVDTNTHHRRTIPHQIKQDRRCIFINAKHCSTSRLISNEILLGYRLVAVLWGRTNSKNVRLISSPIISHSSFISWKFPYGNPQLFFRMNLTVHFSHLEINYGISIVHTFSFELFISGCQKWGKTLSRLPCWIPVITIKIKQLLYHSVWIASNESVWEFV